MSAQVVVFPNAAAPRWATLSVAEARDVIARPDLHEAGAVLDACDVLEGLGDWIDVSRARHLRTAVLREVVAEIDAKARRARRVAAAGAVTVGVLVLVGAAATVEAALRALATAGGF
jgi:hypothetical protein